MNQDDANPASLHLPCLPSPEVSTLVQLSPHEMREQRLGMPIKLYAMLSRAPPSEGFSWHVDGQRIQIQDGVETAQLLENYFDQGATFETLQQLLHLWNFVREGHGTYRHPYFVRDRLDLLAQLVQEDECNKPSTHIPTRPSLLPLLSSMDSPSHQVSFLRPKLAFSSSPYSMMSANNMPFVGCAMPTEQPEQPKKHTVSQRTSSPTSVQLFPTEEETCSTPMDICTVSPTTSLQPSSKRRRRVPRAEDGVPMFHLQRNSSVPEMLLESPISSSSRPPATR